uniref:Uncharacterized protein n=1 Tax=Chromera velia CCMP2878 TaxID=1169474 RepID=A0A0G4G4X0_9ALVE|eukprot:Cvel_4174.t1-p1 / transcript=Cvel_4174.t1 / gene=Cvel_4174 / organism=Chromera_velia_CCMP2878 / gene_product=hypothetical protein / transcript_product=hypothetical protein / location=Cvel_scaffold180:11861-15051(-) / protein_length=642 / sequence_SO=supercontig / SO=protein_coding / is_pseudo=false
MQQEKPAVGSTSMHPSFQWVKLEKTGLRSVYCERTFPIDGPRKPFKRPFVERNNACWTSARLPPPPSRERGREQMEEEGCEEEATFLQYSRAVGYSPERTRHCSKKVDAQRPHHAHARRANVRARMHHIKETTVLSDFGNPALRALSRQNANKTAGQTTYFIDPQTNRAWADIPKEFTSTQTPNHVCNFRDYLSALSAEQSENTPRHRPLPAQERGTHTPSGPGDLNELIRTAMLSSEGSQSARRKDGGPNLPTRPPPWHVTRWTLLQQKEKGEKEKEDTQMKEGNGQEEEGIVESAKQDSPPLPEAAEPTSPSAPATASAAYQTIVLEPFDGKALTHTYLSKVESGRYEDVYPPCLAETLLPLPVPNLPERPGRPIRIPRLDIRPYLRGEMLGGGDPSQRSRDSRRPHDLVKYPLLQRPSQANPDFPSLCPPDAAPAVLSKRPDSRRGYRIGVHGGAGLSSRPVSRASARPSSSSAVGRGWEKEKERQTAEESGALTRPATAATASASGGARKGVRFNAQPEAAERPATGNGGTAEALGGGDGNNLNENSARQNGSGEATVHQQQQQKEEEDNLTWGDSGSLRARGGTDATVPAALFRDAFIPRQLSKLAFDPFGDSTQFRWRQVGPPAVPSKETEKGEQG